MAKKIKVTLVKSLINTSEKQRKIAKALGLKKINSSVVHEDTPSIRGMVNSIDHLLLVEEVEA